MREDRGNHRAAVEERHARETAHAAIILFDVLTHLLDLSFQLFEAVMTLCYASEQGLVNQYWINMVENSLLTIVICRKWKRRLPFATQIEPYQDEEE
jgi:hypothetical protein